jgi:UDP-N-acetylglucosamine--dolichyl-phosphate N-acetylglucosaminephosphotransferase
MKKINKVGIDFHKLNKPLIPEMGGLAILISVITASFILAFLNFLNQAKLYSFVSTILLAGLIGLIDDLKPLSPKLKPALTALASLPIILFNAYDPHPYLPFIGRVRLTILYPLLIPFGIAVPANAVNMMDVFNGVMPGTCCIISLTALIVLIFLGRLNEAFLPMILLGSLTAFYLYNKFPAKVFSGDVGSLTVGAAIGAIAILTKIELVMVVVLMPHIMNAFYGLSSIGRLYERREIKSRPIILLEDGRLAANLDEKAPITLSRIILAQEPLTEKQIFNIIMLLTLISSALAFLTLLLLR